jgi:hypothetical protein
MEMPKITRAKRRHWKMTGSMKRRWLWGTVVALSLAAFAAQAVYAQIGTPRTGGIDPFAPALTAAGDSGKIVSRRPPTRDPLRPIVRSPFIP